MTELVLLWSAPKHEDDPVDPTCTIYEYKVNDSVPARQNFGTYEASVEAMFGYL